MLTPNDLYGPLLMEAVAQGHGLLEAALSEEGDTLSIVKGYVRAKAGVFADSAATLRLHVAETRGPSSDIRVGLDEDIRRLYDELVERLASVLERGVEKKVLRKLDPYYMAVALEGLTNAFLLCWLEDPERHPYERSVAMITGLFLRGSLRQ